MIKKAAVSAVLLFVFSITLMWAQDKGSVDVTLDVKLNVGEYTKAAFSDEEIRSPAANYKNNDYLQFGPLDGNWFTEDSVIRFSYARETFGGSLVLKPANFGTPPWKAWAMLGPMFRVTAGNDIESLYADPQGADPGLRVYNGSVGGNGWDGSLNPDNITQDKGLLVEGMFGPVTAAVTGLIFQGKKFELPTDGTEYYISENRSFQAAARVGSEIGKWGKVNGSYYLLYNKQGASYDINNGELVPVTNAKAEVFTHYFGLYTSLTPLENLGVTLGYGGVLTKYLDEFWDKTSKIKQETVQPLVMQNAVMLNARYTDVIPGLTVRTDHNYTFWMDKNLSALAGNIAGWNDRNAESKTTYPDSPDVTHFLLWNGLGASYQLTGLVGLELYARNLFRRDTALETGGVEYRLDRDEFSVEPKVVLTLSPMVKVSFSVVITNTVTTASDDLNLKGKNLFKPSGGSNYRLWETKDTNLVITIPIGLTMQF